MTSDLNFLEYYKDISNTLTNLEKPVNVFDFAKDKRLSVEESQYILNSFIIQKNTIDNFIIIFRAEILEFDQINKIEKISIKFFPNYSTEMLNVISNHKDKILDFGIYCILNKIEDFVLNDYSVLAHEMQNIKLINLDEFPVVNNKNNSNIANSKVASKNVPISKTSNVVNKHFEKNFEEKISINKASKKAYNFNIKLTNHF